MRRAAQAVACVALAACGRLRFDPLGPGGDDASPGGDGAGSGDGTASTADCAQQPNALVCDGFEPNSPVVWTPVIGNGTVDFSPEQVHSGTQALRAEGISGRTVAFVSTPIPTVASGEIHLRGFFYRPATAAAVDLDLSRVGDGIANSEFFGIANGSDPGVDPGAGVVSQPPALAPDAWICVELHVANNTVALDVDGVQRVSGALDAFGPYSEVAFGITRDAGTPDQYLVFVDDIVAATAPIGCN